MNRDTVTPDEKEYTPAQIAAAEKIIYYLQQADCSRELLTRGINVPKLQEMRE